MLAQSLRLRLSQRKRTANHDVGGGVERKALLEQAYITFACKGRAWEKKQKKLRRALGLPRKKRDYTPEQRGQWNAYLLKSRKELKDWLVERMRKELAGAPKASGWVSAKRELRSSRKAPRKCRAGSRFPPGGVTAA